jgi:hypothetical protein
MITTIASLLHVDPWHVQCLLPVIGMFAAGGIAHFIGHLKGWWAL